MAPAKMKAAVTCGEPDRVEVREIDAPKPGPTDVLVKVVAAATNPADWKFILWGPSSGNVVGFDFAGTVEETGSEVPPGKFKVGDRVVGMVHGGAFPNGAFAEYVAAQAALLLPLPESWYFEQGAQVAAAGYTACMCLYLAQSLPSPLSPAKEPIDLLVWGGASSVGQYVIQLAHLGGLRVLATSSPKNFPLLKSLGADLVYSYADPETPQKIREATGGRLAHAVDCISEGDTPDQVARAMGNSGGEVSVVSSYESRRPDVKVTGVVALFLLGKDIESPRKFPLDVEQYKFAPRAVEILTTTLANGTLKPGPVKLMPNGLASVNDGLHYLKQGKASGEKVTYLIASTP